MILIQERKKLLVLRSDLQRETLSLQVAHLQHSLQWIGWISNTVQFLRNHPIAAVGAGGVLAGLQGNQLPGILGKAVGAFKVVRSVFGWWRNRK